MKEVTKKELLVLIKPDREAKGYEKAEEFVVGIPVDPNLDENEEEKAVDAWIMANVSVWLVNARYILNRMRVENIPFVYDFKHDLDEAGEPFTIYWQKDVAGAKVMVRRTLNTWKSLEKESEFVGQVIDVFENVMTTICKNEEGLINGNPEEVVFIRDGDYDAIAWEVRNVVDEFNLADQTITSEEALKTAINVIFRPFLQILSQKGWDKYFHQWDRFAAFDKVKRVFENWSLVTLPEKKWLLKMAYSWGDEESDQRFTTEEEAWNEAKKLAVEEVQIQIDEGKDADLKFYANQKHIELHYYSDDSWCYYDVIAE